MVVPIIFDLAALFFVSEQVGSRPAKSCQYGKAVHHQRSTDKVLLIKHTLIRASKERKAEFQSVSVSSKKMQRHSLRCSFGRVIAQDAERSPLGTKQLKWNCVGDTVAKQYPAEIEPSNPAQFPVYRNEEIPDHPSHSSYKPWASERDSSKGRVHQFLHLIHDTSVCARSTPT